MLQIPQEARAGTAVKVLCAKHNISPATFHAWKRKIGGRARGAAPAGADGGERAAQAAGGRRPAADPDPQGGERKKW